MTQPDLQDVLREYRQFVSAGRARLGRLAGGAIEVASAGSRVFDARGRAFLNCGGYGVFILGHCHERVTRAVVAQVQRHPLATRMLLEPRVAGAARALAEVTPAGLDYVHFVTSGAEATEAAIKIARTQGKRKLVSMHGGYHGKTMGALSVTARDLYQQPFRPLLPETWHVPFGDAAALGEILSSGEGHCVVVEPVQAENGVVIPPDGYLREVEALCRRYGAFFVLDEIQTGLGRLGTWWGADREGVIPDVLLVGKGLSGGVVPVAAAVASAGAYAVLNKDPFLHTSTFASAPLAMAAAEAAVKTITDEDIVARARHLGERLLPSITAILTEECPALVREVRGLGLLLGLEFCSEEVAGDFILTLLDAGVIVNHSLNAQRVVRLTPPAILDEADIGWLEAAITESARDLGRRYSGLEHAAR